MPIYAFRCGCGNTAEVKRTIDDREQPVNCDECGEQMHRSYNAGHMVIRIPNPLGRQGHNIRDKGAMKDWY